MNGMCSEKVSDAADGFLCNKTFSDLVLDPKKATMQREHETSRKVAEDKSHLPALQAAYTSILRELGEDVDRQGLLRTPLRAAKAMQFLTKGYHETVEGESAREDGLGQLKSAKILIVLQRKHLSWLRKIVMGFTFAHLQFFFLNFSTICPQL